MRLVTNHMAADLMNGSGCGVTVVHMDKELVIFSHCGDVCDVAPVDVHIKGTTDGNRSVCG